MTPMGGSADVYLWESGSLRLINTKSDGSDPDASARMADISGDGRYVVFQSSGDYTDDASDRDDSDDDVYRKDLQTGSVKLVSIADGGAQITDSEAALPDTRQSQTTAGTRSSRPCPRPPTRACSSGAT